MQPGNIWEDFKRGSIQTKDMYFNTLNFMITLMLMKKAPYVYVSQPAEDISLDPSTWFKVGSEGTKYTYGREETKLLTEDSHKFYKDEIKFIYHMHAEGYIDGSYFLSNLPAAVKIEEDGDMLKISTTTVDTFYVGYYPRVYTASSIDLQTISEIVIILLTMNWSKLAGQFIALFSNSIKNLIGFEALGDDFSTSLPKILDKLGG